MPVWDKADFDNYYWSSGERHGHRSGRPSIVLHYHDYAIGQHQRGRYAPLLHAILTANGLVAGDSVILVGGGFNWTGEGLELLGVDVLSTDISNYIQAEKGNTEEAEIRQACLDAGVDPDVDKIYCVPTDAGAALTLDSNRVAATIDWLTNPSKASSRAAWVSKHGPLPSEAEVSTVPNEQLGNWQWARDPLDVLLRGGRAAPQVRGHGTIMDEELRVQGSRNRVYNKIVSLGYADSRFIITEEVLNSITDAEGVLVCDYIQRFIADHGGTCVHMLSAVPQNTAINPGLNFKTYSAWRTHLDANGFGAHMILPTVTARQQGMFMPTGAVVEARLIAAGIDPAKAALIAANHEATNRVEAYSGLI
jgi:hypothetical protein